MSDNQASEQAEAQDELSKELSEWVKKNQKASEEYIHQQLGEAFHSRMEKEAEIASRGTGTEKPIGIFGNEAEERYIGVDKAIPMTDYSVIMVKSGLGTTIHRVDEFNNPINTFEIYKSHSEQIAVGCDGKIKGEDDE